MLCCLTWFAESDPCELCPPSGLLSRNTDTVSSRISLHSVARKARGPLAERQTSLLSVCGRSSHWWVSVRLRCCSKPPHRAPRFLVIRFKRRLTAKTKTGMNHGKRQSNGGKKEKTSPEWPLTKRRVSSRCAREARSKDSRGARSRGSRAQPAVNYAGATRSRRSTEHISRDYYPQIRGSKWVSPSRCCSNVCLLSMQQ